MSAFVATRRWFLGAMLALASAPALSGFRPTQVASIVGADRYINVIDFGADSTGNRESWPALQAAIDEAMKTGAAVFVPAGTYRCMP